MEYVRVIQGNFGYYGWEDMSEYPSNSRFICHDLGKALAHDLQEYKASGQGVYRVINRRIKDGSK